MSYYHLVEDVYIIVVMYIKSVFSLLSNHQKGSLDYPYLGPMWDNLYKCYIDRLDSEWTA